MKNLLKIAVGIGFISILIIPLFAAGRQEGNSAGVTASSDESVTVTDCLGREVKVELPVERIIITHYSSAEALKVLNAWDKVVGRDGYTSDELLYPGLSSIPAVTEMMGSPYTPNMEMIFSLEPDLLILEVIPMPGIEALIEKIQGVIPVVAVKTYDPEKMFHSFKVLGQLLQRENEADAFCSWVQNVQDSLLDKTGGLEESEKTAMFYKTSYGNPEDLMTFSNDMSYVPARDRISGAVNIASDLPSQGGWVPSIDPEWLAQQDFDVLVIGDPLPGCYGAAAWDHNPQAAYRKKVMELPVFSASSAVKNGRVHMMADEFFGTPRNIVGFAYLAKWMHPDLFEQLEPAEIHQEYFNRFLRVNADVVDGGLFVYPK